MNFTLKKSDLNFKVYTVAAKPTTPGAENDIAIISSVPLTNWFMSPDKPSGIPRTDGDVWIQYSTQGNTKNILKQDALMIATISAWQYVDGAWVSREAVSCHGGEWVDWIKYLYDAGNQFVDVTGGWEGKHTISGSTTSGAKLAVNDDHLTVTNVSGGSFGAVTRKKIDITGFSFIYAEVIGHPRLSVADTYPTSVSNFLADFAASAPYTNKTKIQVNISGIGGERYVTLASRTNSETPLEIYKVWMV